MCLKSRTKHRHMNLEQDAYDVVSADKFLGAKFKADKKRRKFRKQLAEFLKNERIPWRKRYKIYIHSDEWKVFRMTIIAQRGMMCERCGKSKGSVDCHHLSYVRLGHELPEDVKLLCRDCHDLMHMK